MTFWYYCHCVPSLTNTHYNTKDTEADNSKITRDTGSSDSTTIHNTTELDHWLEDARKHIEEKLEDGPVIL